MTVLTGRPYNLYDRGLNLDLPRKLADQGRTLLPLDMLDADTARLLPRYRNTYWLSGKRILGALAETAASADLDPVHLTNFNCGPDSFLLSYAEDIMGQRPLLALELDEHGSDTGYQTRIEAYADVLRRAPARSLRAPSSLPEPTGFKERTVWFGSMHPLGSSLLVAAFERCGYRARALPPEDQESFEIGRRVTRGSECLPAALTIGCFLRAMATEGGQGRHALFMPSAVGPCRFGQYCTLDRLILDREGYEDVAIWAPSAYNAYRGLSGEIRRSLWQALVASDVMLKAMCKIRPYEIEAGATDRVVADEMVRLATVVRSGGDLATALGEAVRHVASVPVMHGERRPIVGIVGEIYVRNNTFASEDVIRAVERSGGEAWMSPVGEWMLYVSSPTNQRQQDGALGRRTLRAYPTYWWMKHWEHRLYAAAGPFLADRHEPSVEAVVAEGRRVMPVNVGGEAVLALGRTMAFKQQGAALVVNCSPFGCMPGATAAAIFRQLSVELAMPIVSMFYDGTGHENSRLQSFLQSALPGRSTAGVHAARPAPAPLRPGEYPVRLWNLGRERVP